MCYATTLTLLTTSLHYNSQSHDTLNDSYSDSENFKIYDWAIREPVEERKLLKGTNILLILLYKYKINNTDNRKLHVLVQVVLVGINPASFNFLGQIQGSQEEHSTCKAVFFTISLSVSIMSIKNC